MSKLEELLQGVDVEWLPLEQVIISLKTGLNPRKNFKLNTDNANGYYVTVREINNGKIVFSDKTDRVNDEALALINNRSNLEEGDILFSGTGTIGRVAVIEEIPKNWNIKEGVYVVKPNRIKIHSKFLAYIFQSEDFFIKSSKKIVGSPVTSLPMKDLKKIQIPIPCPDNPEKSLEIQQEIVRVLDELTSLTNQLKTELESERQNRKKQFEFFREQLFSFEEGEAELKNLKDVAKISNGKDHKIFKDGSIPVYGSGGIMRYIDTSIYEEESVLIPRKGSIGNIFYVNEPFWTVDTIFYTKINIEIIIPKYFYYFLKTKDLKELNFAGGVPSLTKTVLDKIKIPIPSLAEQERIVKLLDQFDATHTAIEEEITKEIKLRTQQYEYYREKILSFPQN